MASDILFLSAVRNRSAHTVESVRSVVSSGLGRMFDFLIVQDLDKDNLSKSHFDHSVFNLDSVGRVRILNTRIGGTFNKCVLLNCGIRRSSHRFVVQQDSDILFSRRFLLSVLKACRMEEAFGRLIFTCKYVETGDMSDPPFRKAGDEVGRTYLLDRRLAEAVGCYDEQIGMGNEEWDLVSRLRFRFGLEYFNLDAFCGANLHMTHGNDTRVPGIARMVNSNYIRYHRNIVEGRLVANPGGWGGAVPDYVEDVV